jgi:transaldolase
MQIFIDTADIEEIRQANSLGVLDGVTTNPSLVARTGKEFESCIREILQLVAGPVSVEVIALEYEKMITEALVYAGWGTNVVIKLPVTRDGLRAIHYLSQQNIKTNCTLCFSPTQALLAAKAGATYISPFVGRLDDISQEGMELVSQIVEIYSNYAFSTKVLAASIRHPMHVLQAALAGADVATIPLAVIDQLLRHPLTDKGIQQFLSDWEKRAK